MSFKEIASKVFFDITTDNQNCYCPIKIFALCLSTPTIILFIAGCVDRLIHHQLGLQEMATAFGILCSGFAGLGIAVTVKNLGDK